jgi:hypothetical protein
MASAMGVQEEADVVRGVWSRLSHRVVPTDTVEPIGGQMVCVDSDSQVD